MLLCTTEGDPEREEQYLSLLRAKQSTGCSSTGSYFPPDRITRFVRDGLPIVCLDRDIDSTLVPLVQVDNRLGARLATEHLLSLGHVRIAHVAGVPELGISEERIEGYRDAHRRAGVPAPPGAAGRRVLHGGRRLRSARPARDARIHRGFAANDLLALGVLSGSQEPPPRARRRLGRRFDDLRLSRYMTPPLTDRPPARREIARHATELLLQLASAARFERMLTCSSQNWWCALDAAPRLTRPSVTAYCSASMEGLGKTAALHIGVVAVGRIGSLHAASFRRWRASSPDADRRRRPAAPGRTADELGASVAGTPRSLVEAGVDALVIATPRPRTQRSSGSPPTPARAFCEKPVALEVPALDDVVAYTDGRHPRADRVPAALRRRLPAAREAVATGAIGNLLVLRAATHDPSPPAEALHRRVRRHLPRPPHP